MLKPTTRQLLTGALLAGVTAFTGLTASAGGEGFDFEISDARVVPGTDFAAKVSAVGAAIKSGSYHMPVTMKVEIDGVGYNVFGDADSTSESNVNDNEGPRHTIIDEVFESGQDIHITATSWSSSSRTYMTVSTDENSQQVKVLRNGDDVPDISGFDGQSDIVAFLTDYIDTDDGTIDIDDDQIIYLFELGTTRLTSSAADFQDLVVLITLGDSPADLEQEETAVAALYD